MNKSFIKFFLLQKCLKQLSFKIVFMSFIIY